MPSPKESPKEVVVFIVGELGDDAFCSNLWSDRATVSKWIKDVGIHQVDIFNKAVTHLVVSRRAWREQGPAIQAAQKRPVERKCPIVTWDWLDDVLQDKRLYTHYDAYDPAKPRDIDAINAGRLKTRRSGGAAKEPSARMKGPPIVQKTILRGDGLSVSAQKKPAATKVNRKGDKEVMKATASLPAAKDANTKAGDSSKSVAKEKKTVIGKKPVSSNSVSLQEHLAPLVCVSKATGSNTVAALQTTRERILGFEDFKDLQSWAAAAKPRAFVGKDLFKYRIILTKDDRLWMLDLEVSKSSSVKKAYRFWANQYNAKHKCLQQETKDPTADFQKALGQFKVFFKTKTGYEWDERLVRARQDQPIWHYKVPAEGKPVGSVPPEFMPGNPKCVKIEDLAPINLGFRNGMMLKRSGGERPGGIRKKPNFSDADWDDSVRKKTSGRSEASGRHAELRNSLSSTALQKKRKAGETIDLEHRPEHQGGKHQSPLQKKRKSDDLFASEHRDEVQKTRSSLPVKKTSEPSRKSQQSSEAPRLSHQLRQEAENEATSTFPGI